MGECTGFVFDAGSQSGGQATVLRATRRKTATAAGDTGVAAEVEDEEEGAQEGAQEKAEEEAEEEEEELLGGRKYYVWLKQQPVQLAEAASWHVFLKLKGGSGGISEEGADSIEPPEVALYDRFREEKLRAEQERREALEQQVLQALEERTGDGDVTGEEEAARLWAAAPGDEENENDEGTAVWTEREEGVSAGTGDRESMDWELQASKEAELSQEDLEVLRQWESDGGLQKLEASADTETYADTEAYGGRAESMDAFGGRVESTGFAFGGGVESTGFAAELAARLPSEEMPSEEMPSEETAQLQLESDRGLLVGQWAEEQSRLWQWMRIVYQQQYQEIRGYLGGEGSDLRVATLSLNTAFAVCASQADCGGFTFEGDGGAAEATNSSEQEAGEAEGAGAEAEEEQRLAIEQARERVVYFKQRAAVNSSYFQDAKGWTTYVKTYDGVESGSDGRWPSQVTADVANAAVAMAVKSMAEAVAEAKKEVKDLRGDAAAGEQPSSTLSSSTTHQPLTPLTNHPISCISHPPASSSARRAWRCAGNEQD
jgi:hypothetical protein